MAKLRVQGRFATTPVELVNNPEISFKAKGLFAFIQSKPDGWKFSAERIANQSKEGVDSVKQGLRELVKAGYLIREKYKDSAGLWEWEYILLEVSNVSPSVGYPSVENPPVDYPSVENQPNTSKIDIQKKKKKEIEDTLAISFEKLWQLYPRKTNKQTAKKAWMKLQPSIELMSEIHASLEKHKQSSQWLRDGGQYVPHFSTFLNQRRWEDEVVIESKPSFVDFTKTVM